VIFKTLLDPGEEVIIQRPFSLSTGFTWTTPAVRPGSSDQEDSLSISMRSARPSRTRRGCPDQLPNNPTERCTTGQHHRLGGTPDRAGKALKRVIYLISDEPYTEIVYDGVKVPSVLETYSHSLIATPIPKASPFPGRGSAISR